MIKTRLILISLIIFTSLTSVGTIAKVFAKGRPLSVLGTDNLNSPLSKVQEIEVISAKSETPVSTSTPEPETINQTTPITTPTIKPLIPTVTPRIVALTPTPTPTISPASSRCLITLQGQLYDVTVLRAIHTGGDIFKCSTDMTALYLSQHGSSLARMQPYLYTAGNTNLPAPTSYPVVYPTITPTSVPKQDNAHFSSDSEDDVNDTEHQDKYYDNQFKSSEHGNDHEN